MAMFQWDDCYKQLLDFILSIKFFDSQRKNLMIHIFFLICCYGNKICFYFNLFVFIILFMTLNFYTLHFVGTNPNYFRKVCDMTSLFLLSRFLLVNTRILLTLTYIVSIYYNISRFII